MFNYLYEPFSRGPTVSKKRGKRQDLVKSSSIIDQKSFQVQESYISKLDLLAQYHNNKLEDQNRNITIQVMK